MEKIVVFGQKKVGMMTYAGRVAISAAMALSLLVESPAQNLQVKARKDSMANDTASQILQAKSKQKAKDTTEQTLQANARQKTNDTITRVKKEKSFSAKAKLSVSSSLMLKNGVKLILLEVDAISSDGKGGIYDVSEVSHGKAIAYFGIVDSGKSVIDNSVIVKLGEPVKKSIGAANYRIRISSPEIGDYRREKSSAVTVSVEEISN